MDHLLSRLPTNALARVNLVYHCLERELRARYLDDHARDDATVRANRVNEDRPFRTYEDYVDQVELTLEAGAAIVLVGESHALRSLVARDCYLPSSYDVERRRATIFISSANLVALGLEGVANRREGHVRVLGSSQG